MANRRCRDCDTTMQTSLIPFPGLPAVDGVYVEVWECPNRQNHGMTVECQNCGEQVPSLVSHVTWTDGLIGSRRYTCMRPLPPTCYAELPEPEHKSRFPGGVVIRPTGTLLCGRRKPCPIHD